MRRSLKLSLKTPVAIVTSSELTATYFSQMRKDCRFENLSVCHIPSLSFAELIKNASRIKSLGRYKEIFVLFSLSEFADCSEEIIKAEEERLKKRNIKLYYTAHSIMLYWALHFERLTGEEDANKLIEIIKRHVPSFRHSAEYLHNEGVNFHLTLFPNKAIASVNEMDVNDKYSAIHSIDAINFTSLMNNITKYCGEADITKNQKVINN